MRYRSRSSGWVVVALTVAGCGDTATGPEPVNRAPRFVGVPHVQVRHDRRYLYAVNVTDDDGDDIVVRAPVLPAWMDFDSIDLVLTGTAGAENIGDHPVKLTASDGQTVSSLTFNVTVVPNIYSLQFEGSWVDAGFVFGHDGVPVSSNHFTVYSGFSSQAERKYVADELEDRLAYLEATLGVSGHDEFEHPAGRVTIDVLTLKHQGNDVFWTGVSYRYGMIVHAPDSPRFVEEGYTRPLYRQLLTHELMHIVEYMLVGTEGHYESVAKWFHEGIATHLAGPPPNRIRFVAQLEDWRKRTRNLGGGNPVAIRYLSDVPEEIANDVAMFSEYYLYFELAVRWLLDADGLGRTRADVKQLYLDIRNGKAFATAFRDRMGISVDEYEDRFVEIMHGYLE